MCFSDRTQLSELLDNENKIKLDFFVCNKMISKPSLKSEKETISPAQSTGLGWRWLPPEIAARWRCVPLIKKTTENYDSQFCVTGKPKNIYKLV